MFGQAPAGGADEPPALRPADHRATERVVHHFDFDERDEGNLESVPKYWEILRPTGFPHFSGGGFDEEVGHDAPPSFHLSTHGRNVAFVYRGPRTRIRANTDYQLVGYVLADHLDSGRAAISAHYVDQSGRPMLESLVRSRWVGGADDAGQWVRLVLVLPPAPPTAERIEVTAWVVQEQVWGLAAMPPRHIPRTDVLGGAWFDDLIIHALPRMRLSTSNPGNVLAPGDRQLVYALLADYDDLSLRGRVSIRDVDGKVVKAASVEVETDPTAQPTAIAIDDLEPGIYLASLDTFASDAHLRSQELTFLKVPPLHGQTRLITRSFGIVIDRVRRSDPEWELALLDRHALHSAKLPIWSASSISIHDRVARRGTERLIHELVKRGFSLTAVFGAPPPDVARRDGAYARPLLEFLAHDPTQWTEHFASAVAPSATAFHWWEIDAAFPWSSDGRRLIETAVGRFRDALIPFITVPKVAMPIPAAAGLPVDKLPVEQVTLRFTDAVPPGSFRDLVSGAKKAGYEHVSVLIEPPPAESFLRLPRLADLARRIVQARHTGAAAVFMPQTWRIEETIGGRFVVPSEDFLVFRTLADAIGDASPGPELGIGNGVRCLSFYRDESAVLVLWDEHAPTGGRDQAIQLGRADRQVDLWGRVRELSRAADGRHVVRLGPAPVIIPDSDRWLVELRASLSITPAMVPSGAESARHRLVLDYAGTQPVSGRIDWEAPEDWSVWPRSLDVTVNRHRTESRDLEIGYPHNESSGGKILRAKMTLNPDGLYLEAPLEIEIGSPDLAITGFAVVEAGELIMRQSVRNLSDQVLSFRVSAAAPGRPRQYRPITNLRPGDRQSVQYRFAGGDDMIGKNVRLSLREVNDGPRTHDLDLVVP